jgi:hypothetical protein
MNREVHVRFCEGVGVKFPRATRPLIYTSATSESSTKYCSSVSKEKVWIKVCNANSQESGRRVYILTSEYVAIKKDKAGPLLACRSLSEYVQGAGLVLWAKKSP